MSEAMKMIVANYVQLDDAAALEDIKAHRARLLMEMRFSRHAAFDPSWVIASLEIEIALVNAGLAAIADRRAESGMT
jgi:hypothetical protein